MKKIIKRTIAILATAAIITLSGFVTLIVFPQSLFAHKLEYKKFNVYSDQKITNNDIEQILDDAYKLTEQCQLHNPEYNFDVFLSHGHIFNKIEDLQGKGPIARATAGNIALKVPIDISDNLAYGKRGSVNLTELLAHEMVHVLQANRYGFINFSPIKHPPLWKLEGYPEYVARQAMLKSNNYNIISEIKRYTVLEKRSQDGFIEVVKGHFMPTYYYKGRLMMEYLIDNEGLTYDSILKDDRTEEKIFLQMLKWAKLN